MSAETDLLPLPEAEYRLSPDGKPCLHDSETLADYARACVSSATEALRAEVEKQSAYAKRTHDWNTELLANNARLAEALLRYGRHEHDCDTRHDAAHKDRPLCTCGLSAALEQETTNG